MAPPPLTHSAFHTAKRFTPLSHPLSAPHPTSAPARTLTKHAYPRMFPVDEFNDVILEARIRQLQFLQPCHLDLESTWDEHYEAEAMCALRQMQCGFLALPTGRYCNIVRAGTATVRWTSCCVSTTRRASSAI